MPRIDLKSAPDDFYKVFAVMLFPNDDALRNQYFAVETARVLVADERDSATLGIDASILRLLIDAPAHQDLTRMRAENSKQGYVAGDLLVSLYLMERFGLPEPSMNKAIFVAQKFAQNDTFGDGSKINASERMIREAWDQFMPVAHLWATILINQVYPFTSEKEMFSEQGLSPFLQAAVALYEFGIEFIPFRAKVKRPILDPATCWALPRDIRPSKLVSDRKPDYLIEILKKYTAPKSSA